MTQIKVDCQYRHDPVVDGRCGGRPIDPYAPIHNHKIFLVLADGDEGCVMEIARGQTRTDAFTKASGVLRRATAILDGLALRTVGEVLNNGKGR